MKKQCSWVTLRIAHSLRGLVWNKKTCESNSCTNAYRWNSTLTWESAKPFNEIPSLPILPFIGTAWQFMRPIGRYDPDRRHLANQDKRKRLGNIVREKFGPQDAVLCFTVEDLERILRSEGTYPYTLELSAVKAYRESRKEVYSSKGLLILQGKEWYDLRAKTQKHLLKPMALQEYLEPLQMVARDFVNKLSTLRDSRMEVPDLHKEICKWSMESVSFFGLDTRLGCFRNDLKPDSDAAKMIDSAMTIFDCKAKLEAFTGSAQFWRYFRTPTWRKFEKASDIYSEIAFKYVNAALMRMMDDTKNQKLTLLQAMLAQKDLSVPDAVIFVADLMMAGIDTTSHAAGFLLYHLARNPEKQDILYKEVMRLMPTEDVKMNPDIFEESKYLKACWKESMRLTPIVPGSARILARDTVLSGYQVHAGTIAAVVYDHIYMDATIYPNPNLYLPERWLDRSERPRQFAFIPFGFGPRSCIGRRLAEIKTVALISEILRKYKVEYHYEDIGMYSKMLNVPDKPLRFKFVER